MLGNDMVKAKPKPKAEKLAYRAAAEYVPPAEPRQERSKVLRRQFVAQPEPPVPVEKTRRSRLQIALVGMACLVVGLGLLVNIQTIQTNKDAKAQVSALSHTSSGDEGVNGVPSETKPTYSGKYSVAPNLPKYIKIPRLGVNARVLPMGVNSTNQLKAPSNIYDAGWYNASAKPGDSGSNGAILIDGHVHGPTLPGVFVGIKNLAADDTIQIYRGDDKLFTYKVVKVQNYDADKIDMGMMLSSIQPGQPGLNLITCGGQFDKSSNEYKQRTAVFAVQID